MDFGKVLTHYRDLNIFMYLGKDSRFALANPVEVLDICSTKTQAGAQKANAKEFTEKV